MGNRSAKGNVKAVSFAKEDGVKAVLWLQSIIQENVPTGDRRVMAYDLIAQLATAAGVDLKELAENNFPQNEASLLYTLGVFKSAGRHVDRVASA